MSTITILGLNNNFYGSYSSNQVFFDELMEAFICCGVRVVTASSLEEAMYHYETEDISFSISFSKYKYFLNGIPLYEIYRKMNYQWVSDNPLKMNLDVNSKWMKYIFIDHEYPLMLDHDSPNGYMFRPLGFLEKNLMESKEKNGRVIIPCKIRNLNDIYKKINESDESFLMKKFLDQYDRDSSYIKSFSCFVEHENIGNKEAVFRLTNEYTRVEKRIWAIEHVYELPVDVLSDDCGNSIKNPNVSFRPTVGYEEIRAVMNSYSFVINVDPNYHSCIHDRFIKAVSSGSICITNKNELTARITPYTYMFSEENSIMNAINLAEKESAYLVLRKAILSYSWEKSAKMILEDFEGVTVNEIPN
ncbi:MAG: hypothetical protein HFH82_10485 [Lachnospiraceae bacterium]|nr:hypothetical protein [Lachnospiraceae bacterium]